MSEAASHVSKKNRGWKGSHYGKHAHELYQHCTNYRMTDDDGVKRGRGKTVFISASIDPSVEPLLRWSRCSEVEGGQKAVRAASGPCAFTGTIFRGSYEVDEQAQKLILSCCYRSSCNCRGKDRLRGLSYHALMPEGTGEYFG